MKINSRKSFICGLKGLKLSKKEINFLRKYKPWGIILFLEISKILNKFKF